MANNIMMHDPLLTETMIDVYFGTGKKTEKDGVYTVPGFALAVGFASTRELLDALKAYDEGTSPYPEAAIRFLQRGLTRLEDYYLQNGLKSKFPHALVKFCLGAYHQVKDTNESSNTTPAQAIMVVFNDSTATAQLPEQQAKQLAAAQPVIEFNAQ